MSYGRVTRAALAKPTTSRARMLAVVILVGGLAAVSGCERHDSWKTESGLKVIEIKEGEGAIANSGDIGSIRFTGWYLDGKMFDTTDRLGAPIKFRFGKGELLPGLDEGVSSMRKGGKRVLIVPPELGYGKEGRPGVVPPNQWLKFEVELVDIQPGPPPILPWNDAGMETIATRSGLQFVDFEMGDGPYPTLGSTVVVHYSGFLGDGTLFDTTYYDGRPVEFELSPKTLIAAWVEGLLTMREGGKRKLIVPPFLGYGAKGFGKAVPPNATLIYDVELLEVRNGRPEE